MANSTHIGKKAGTNNGFELLECQTCGFTHLDPIPTREELERIYPKEYYSSHYPGWIEKTLSEVNYWNMVYSGRFELFERFVKENKPRVLDIGSFLGLFLAAGKARGWEVLGVEPSDQGVDYAVKNGVPTKHGFFQDFKNEELGQFDAINLSLSLEHVPNPLEILEKAKSILKPNGIICIEVPNDFSPIQRGVQRALNKPEYWLAAPHHINYFNFESLSKVMDRLGFEVVDKTATFPMEFFLLFGDDYLGNDTLGRACHQRRMKFELNLEKAGLKGFKTALYDFFATQGIGREVVLTGRLKK